MRKSQVDYNIKDRPSAAKAGLFSRVIMYELKPVPFKLKSGLALVAAFVAASLCMAQAPKRPMTFDDMMAMKRLGETAVSPDGKWLVYSVTTVNLAQNSKDTWLWEQEIGSADKASFKMAVAQLGDGGVQFSPDGRSVLFLSSRDGGQQIWLASFDSATGATANAKKITGISTEADNAQWTPDGQSVVFTSSVYPDCPAMGPADGGAGDPCNAQKDAALAASKVKAQIFTHLLYRHWDHFTGDKRSHLFVVAVDGSALRDLTPNDPHDVPPYSTEGGGGFAISPDSKELAFTENPDAEPATSVSAQIYTLDLTNFGAKPVKISTSLGGNFNPAYSPDGHFVAWRSEARAGYESDKFRLWLYDRAAKTGKDLLPKFENWVDEFSWIGDSQHILFVAGDAGEAPIYEVNVTGDDLSRSGKAAGEWGGVHMVLVKGFPYILGTLVRVDRPAEVVLGNALELDDTARKFGHGNESSTTKYDPPLVTHLNDSLLTQLDLPKMEDYWFTAKDGTKLQGFVIPPPGYDPAKKYPVKFLIHGGPQGAWGDMWSYRWNAELFAANGYVVVMVNPRGSTGYGQAVVDGVNGDWGGKPFSDLMLGLDEAEKKFPFIDKTRECALGASYGGFMADWVLTHTDRFKCIVTHDGMYDPVSAFGATEELWFNEWEFRPLAGAGPDAVVEQTKPAHPWDFYGKPASEDPFRKWSPMMFIKDARTPTLVVHSQRDYRLDVSQGLQLFTALQLLGVPSKMLYFPDEGHWVLKPQNSELWFETVDDWCDRWTGMGKYAGVGAEKNPMMQEKR